VSSRVVGENRSLGKRWTSHLLEWPGQSAPRVARLKKWSVRMLNYIAPKRRRDHRRHPHHHRDRSSHQRSAEFLSETDEKSFGPPDVAEPIRVLVLDHFAHELRAALAEPSERMVDVLHGEHDA
jgi:hypothetical protein